MLPKFSTLPTIYISLGNIDFNTNLIVNVEVDNKQSEPKYFSFTN